MVPDDIIKPPHIGIAIAKLTPATRPAGLTDHISRIVRRCAAADRKLDAVEIHECLTKGPCSKKLRKKVSLEMVLFVVARRKGSRATRRDPSRRS